VTIERARSYLRRSAAVTICVHWDAPFYPLGEVIAGSRPLPPGLENMKDSRGPWQEV